MAEKFNYTENYLTKNFNALYDIKLNQYINKIKIEKCVKTLQADPDITINDLAKIAGFSRVDYFRKVFKNFTGFSHISYTNLRDIADSNNGKCLPYINMTTHKNNFTIKDLQELAKSKGGKCLSKIYTRSNSKYIWQCDKGHEWTAALYNVKNGTWCPVCNKRISYSLDDMHKIAEAKGGICLTKEYININHKIKWECKYGHVFEAKPRPILKNIRWCKICKRIEKNKIIIEALKEIIEENQYR